MLSYGEKLLRAYLKRCFPSSKALYNYRECGIVNPKTGFPLEIDVYYPEKKLGFEFHGRQHLTDEEQRARDKEKRRQAKNLGITLIEVWTSTLEKNLYEIIIEKAPGSDAKKPTKKFQSEFSEKASEYKKNIYKMNKSLTTSTFSRRKSGKKTSYKLHI